MQPLHMLIEAHAPAWPLVSSWFDAATNPLEVLRQDVSRRGTVLHALQITTASPMGAIVHETAGVLVDHGWLRILGGAGARMAGDLASWNGLGPRPISKTVRGLLVIAHDAAGGVFALDRGALGPGRNGVWYLGPDDLRWVAVHRGYSYFLEWACTGDVAGFGGRLRWEGWEEDVAKAGPDRAFVATPARWTPEGRHTTRANLVAVPMPRLFALELETGRRMHAEAITHPAAPQRRISAGDAGQGRRTSR